MAETEKLSPYLRPEKVTREWAIMHLRAKGLSQGYDQGGDHLIAIADWLSNDGPRCLCCGQPAEVILCDDCDRLANMGD